MSDSAAIVEMISAAASQAVLDDYAVRLKYEIDNGYTWTADAAEVATVRDAWGAKAVEFKQQRRAK